MHGRVAGVVLDVGGGGTRLGGCGVRREAAGGGGRGRRAVDRMRWGRGGRGVGGTRGRTGSAGGGGGGAGGSVTADRSLQEGGRKLGARTRMVEEKNSSKCKRQSDS